MVNIKIKVTVNSKSRNKKKTVALFRCSPPKVLLRKDVLRKCNKFTGDYICQIQLLWSFIEITLQRGCSPVKLCVFAEHLWKDASEF